jgi:hypothetical protein
VRDRAKLGQILVSAGVVDQGVLDGLLREQPGDGRRLGEMLVARGILDGTLLTQVLATQLALPWVSLAKVNPDPALLELVPRDLAKRHRVVPVYLRRDPRDAGRGTLYVATDDPLNEAAHADCARAARVEVRWMVAAPEELEPAIALFYDGVAPPSAPQEAPAAPPAHAATGTGAKAAPPGGQGPKRTVSVGAMHAVVLPGAPPPAPAPAARPPVPAPPRKPEKLPDPAAKPAAHAEVHLADADLVEEATTPDPPSATLVKGTAVILVVKAPLSLVRNCRMAASALGARVVKADLTNAAERARENAPFAVVVTEAVYAFDRLGLSQLALANGALLVIWSDELQEEYLEPLLATAHERWSGAFSSGAARP